jgi:hypothetical protein
MPATEVKRANKQKMLCLGKKGQNLYIDPVRAAHRSSLLDVKKQRCAAHPRQTSRGKSRSAAKSAAVCLKAKAKQAGRGPIGGDKQQY